MLQFAFPFTLKIVNHVLEEVGGHLRPVYLMWDWALRYGLVNGLFKFRILLFHVPFLHTDLAFLLVVSQEPDYPYLNLNSPLRLD